MELHCIAQRTGKLSTFLHRELRCSSTFINKNKWLQGFFVNGVSQRTNYMVQPGDEIRVPIQEPLPEYPAQDRELSILYEDEAVIAIDKPAGMLMHPSFHRNTDTLANYLVGYYQRTGQACAVHPVSRLDRDTFGVVLLAKNAYTHAILFEDMQAHRIHKTYEALVYGGPEADAGVLDDPIIRLPKPSLLRWVDPAGQEARTEFQVLERADGRARLSLRPITGRTHQLRVHCAYNRFPILGDPQYGSAESQDGYFYQQLCAVSLTFPHPMTGEEMTVQSRQGVFLEQTLGQRFPILLTEHQPCWDRWYREETALLEGILPPGTKIHHIGSTAVEGIWAKPIVDILAELPRETDGSSLEPELAALGYQGMRQSAERYFFRKGYTAQGFDTRVFHLHLRHWGDCDEVYFRDRLRAEPAVAQAYEQLKLRLWREFAQDRGAYTEGKTAFIRRHTEAAQADSASGME